MLQRKAHDAPSAPAAVAEEVPEDLNELCLRLLCVDPSMRPTGREVLSCLSTAGSSREVETLELPVHAAPCGDDAVLVGRQRHRAALSTAFETVRAGRPVLMLLSGRSGSGKSTLLNAFLNELSATRQAVVLSGRCHERDSVPYRALDSVVDELSRHLKELPTERTAPSVAARRGTVDPDVPRPARRAGDRGVYRKRGNRRSDGTPPPRHRRAAQLLAAIAHTTPLVIAIDDLHWGDVENALLIEELLRPPRAGVADDRLVSNGRW